MVHKLTGGGAERVAALWIYGFTNHGHDVRVVMNCQHGTPITYQIPQYIQKYNLHGNFLISWIVNKLNKWLGIDCYYVKKIRHVLQDFQPDVAIGVIQPWAEWTRKAAKGMNLKIINTEHNTFERPSDALYNPMTKALYREKFKWNKRYDAVSVLTKVDKSCTEGILNNVTVLPNPLAYCPVSKLPSKENIILAAGRLNAWHVKGFDLLVNAWGKIAKQHPCWKLQIAGSDNEPVRKKLMQIAREKEVESQIEFLGFQNDMLPLYQRSSIFVLSSRYEGFGMVLIEAMSQGCAPIACDYKGRQSEIITTEEEGIICPVCDIVSLASSLEKMITDEEYRKNVQIKAIERSKYYSLERTMDRWEQIFKDLNI
ncbi:MAG: glycosyltransferase [Bacteroidaceae bacterium]|nr:glycosyltransferase [Bacteroidaceae bacterium]